MKIRLIYIFTILLISVNLTAQSSVHLSNKLSHKKHPQSISQNQITTTNGINSLKKTVFGFLPYWELYNENLTLRYDLLTHIALFDFLLENDGSISFPPEWNMQIDKWDEIISDAKANDVKVIMTISNLSLVNTDSLLVSNLINNQTAKNNFFSDVKTIISDYNFDGINLDFENPKLSERGDPINNFTQELRDSLDAWFTGKELSFATPAVNWGSRWKLKELSEICDFLFIMAYDYHGSWSTNAGPEAPLDGLPHNYHTMLDSDYVNVNPSKIILGVPYYGAFWRIDNNNIYSNVDSTNWLGKIDYRKVDWTTFGNSISFDDISQTTYILSPIDNDYNLLWIDTEVSLSLKYDFAFEKNLKGVGIWSLGKDGNYPELWNLIEEKFADSTTSVEQENLSDEFVLYQNYPNPFNPTTTIKFAVPTSPSFPLLGKERDERVRLIVYNMLGQQVATLVNEQKSPGIYEVQFDASSFASGIYFYSLTSGKFSQTKKLLLLR